MNTPEHPEHIHPVRRDTTDAGKLDNVNIDAERAGLTDTSAAIDPDAAASITDE
jgi:hypothetical protein